jgi:hypothetical protein
VIDPSLAEVDYFSAFNDFGGFFNTPNYPNPYAFVALKADGSITAWGHSSSGGSLVNAGDRLPRSSTWTKNLLGGHLTFGAISALLLF